MAGVWTTLTVKDAGGNDRTMRVWDESGTGAGPFSFGQMQTNGLGGAIDYGAGASNTATQRVTIGSEQFGDMSSSRVNSAASTNANNLKASAGIIRSIDVFNNAAYSVFLKLYNKASSPTVGTDTPVWTIPLPTASGYSKQYFSGLPFTTGISYAITKLQADSDTTVIAAGDVTGIIAWL